MGLEREMHGRLLMHRAFASLDVLSFRFEIIIGARKTHATTDCVTLMGLYQSVRLYNMSCTWHS